jgi:hypothetical protein
VWRASAVAGIGDDGTSDQEVRMLGGAVGSGRRITGRSVGTRLVLAALAVSVLGAAVGCGDRDDAGAHASPVADAVSARRPEAHAETDAAVWPAVSGSVRFADPVSAARTFAVEYVGFVDPLVGSFHAVDARSGDVPVRDHQGGPITTVQVRMLSPGDSWWVTGAASTILAVDQPLGQATIPSPFPLEGRSAAFKPTVDVQVRQDDHATPLEETTVDGGANNQMAPFSASITYPQADVPLGAVVLTKLSATDGNVAAVAVVRVRFAEVASEHPAWDHTGG